MRTETGTMRGAGGVELHTVDWSPEGEPVADVVLVHGYGEHSGRYEPVAQVLTDAGLRVAALDLRGHGRSTGLRKGDIDSFDAIVDDVEAFVAAQRTDRPLFVYGHSMGGLAVVRLLERGTTPVTGAVIASAALAAAESIPAPLVKVANVLGKLAPNLRTIALDGNAVSRDEQVRADYDADPLNFRGKLTAGTGREMNLAMEAAHADAGRIQVPVLVIHGLADALTAPVGSERLVAEVGSADVTFRTWPGAYHELHHEPERDEVLSTIVSWVRDRAGAPGS